MGKKLKMLIVDDEYSARKLLEHLLCKLGTCDMAGNGREAVTAVEQALARNEPYDLICLDIQMPNLDGQEALKEIRQLETDHGIWPGKGARIIMTTAIDDSSNIMKAFIEQCESYLIKPIERVTLLREMVKQGLIDPDHELLSQA